MALHRLTLPSFFSLALLFAAAAFGQDAAGKAKTLSGGAEFDINSRYIWRSLAYSQGAVWQPSAWIGTSGFTFSVWGNYVLHREENYFQFNEIDYRLSYAREFGPLKIEPAFTAYSYLHQPDSPTTGEFELLLSFDLGPFSIATAHFLDVGRNPGGYIGEIGLEFERTPSAALTVNASARLTFANSKFNAYYVPLRKSALNAFVLELGLTVALTEAISIRPHFEWHRILDQDVKAALTTSTFVSGGKASQLNFGVAFAIEF
jgi:hypothetical protein